MTSKHKSEDYKLSAVEYYLVGDKSQIDVCKIFKCSPRSLMRWVEKYEKDGEIKRENRKPVAYKVHKEHVKFLLDEINKNKTITITSKITSHFLHIYKNISLYQNYLTELLLIII